MVWNRLSDRKVTRIILLHREGLSYPQIAKRLRINRETVGRYIRKLKEPTRVISVALYASDLNKLKREADRRGRSIGDVVRVIIYEALGPHRRSKTKLLKTKRVSPAKLWASKH